MRTADRLTVSVIIPVLDDAEFLENCLTSLGLQSRQADEIIVVDNGSKDHSVAIARAHGATVVTEPRPGITAASSRGFDEARGDVLARCDADSVLPRNWIETIGIAFESKPGLAAVTGPGSFYDMNPVKAKLADFAYMRGYFVLLRAALANNALFGSNFAIRATEWRKLSALVPRDDTELHDDIDLSFRLGPRALVRFDPQLVVGISGRPFRSITEFRHRLRRAHHTIAVHWRIAPPSRRWRERSAG